MSLSFDISDSNISPNFKTVYPSYINTAFSSRHKVLQLIKSESDASGNVQAHGINLSYAAGASTGGPSSPTRGKKAQTNYTLKELFCSVRIDVKSLKLARKKEGAFIELDKLALDSLQKQVARTMAIMFWGNADGALGVVDAAGSVTNNDPTFTLPLSDFRRPQLHVGMIINVGNSTDNFEITDVDIDNEEIDVKRISGSYVPAAGDTLYLENSKDSAWTGVKKVVDTSSGSLYGVTVQTGWKATKKAVSNSEPVSGPLIEQMLDNIENESDEVPDVIVASRSQYKKLKALKDDIETLPLKDRSASFVLGSNIKHFVYDDMNIPILKDNLVEEDRIYFLNSSHITKRTAGDGGFVMNDAGKPFHSEIILGRHSLLVVFYVLGEFFIEPHFQGCLDGLSTNVRA